MKALYIDIETYSSADLAKCGVYRYAEAPGFEVLLFGYSVDGEEVQVADLARGEKLPCNVVAALTDETVTKWAFNANFERVCLSRWLGMPLGQYLNPCSWRCTMVWSAYMGLPLSLEGAGTVLNLDKQKLKEGKELIRCFCKPCKPTAANAYRTRNLPSYAPNEWEAFKAYNQRDVEAELTIHQRLSKHPVPETVWAEYHLDQEINDRGVALDITLVKEAISMDRRSRDELTSKIRSLTELANPNSVMQMKEWLLDNGIETDSLGKKSVAELLKGVQPELQEVLSLRQQLAKSSVRKYLAMQNCVCADERARGLFQFYGASRTGRWAGRFIQAQNLPTNHIKDLSQARSHVRNANYEAVEMLYDSVPDTLSQLVRTAFVPKPGCRFIVADFASIERVVLSWIAGERWVLEAYRAKEDLYIATASKMFRVPSDQIDKKSPLRQKGKVADLACIAQGQLVLTDKGLVPIEDVTILHRVWDGESWVAHDGVVFRGIREVIEYEGLRATPDHLVWVEGESEPVRFKDAASSRTPLVKTGDYWHAIRLGENNQRKARLYDIRNAGQHHRFTVSGKLVHNCGYGGSVGALQAMGALDMGLTEEELKPLVDAWRTSNPKIVRFWWDVDKAAIDCVKQGVPTKTHGIHFIYQSGLLFIELPSGRRLSYVRPRLDVNRFGSDCITYEGIGTTKKWERLESYGPKFVENIAQAIARDIFSYAMQNLRNFGIVMHIHDEFVIEADKHISLTSVCEQMSKTPLWAKGLTLRAEGFEADFYRKD